MRVRRSLSAVLASVIAIFGLAAVAIEWGASPAQARVQASPTWIPGCITGTVLDEQGANVQGDVTVTLMDSGGLEAGFVQAAADGTFCLSTYGLAEADYYIEVTVAGGPYEGAVSPGLTSDGSQPTIHVTPGEMWSGADFSLHKFPAVSGHVSFSPESVGSVSLIDVRTGFPIDTRQVGSDGAYFVSTEGVARGEYAIRFDGADGWYARLFPGVPSRILTGRVYAGGATTLAAATRYLVAANEDRTGVDIAGSAPAGHVQVQMRRSLGGAGWSYFPGTIVLTGPDGETYVLHTDSVSGSDSFAVPAGHYTYGATATGYATVSGAVDVSASTPSIQVNPVPGALVSGTVKSGGVAVDGARISLVRTSDWAQYWSDWGFEPWPAEILPLGEQGTSQTAPAVENTTTYTDASGYFSVANVPPGTYTVYIDGQFQGVPSVFLGGSTKRAAATTFTVAGAPVGLGNIALPAYGQVSGTVTWDSTTALESFIAPMAFAYDSGTGTWNLVAMTYVYLDPAATQESYWLELPAGTYRIGMANVGGGIAAAPGLAAEYFSDVVNIDDATTVTVTNGTTRAGVNFALSALSPVSSTRYAGADRYATAVEVSKTFSPGVSVVYVASGENFPDALAAAPAAAASGGPLLTVRHNGVPDVVAAELARLNPDRIVVVGGLLSVDAATYNELATYAGAGGISRVFGANRYATAQAIVDDYWGTSGSTSVWIASGKGFPDALSAAAAAGSVGAPVITVDGSATTLDPAVVQMIQDLHATTVYIAGGFVSVSASLEAQLKGVPGVTTVTRRAGGDRYSTGAAINYYSFDHPSTAYIANGTNFPDALAGAALAGQNQAPLYIVPGACVPNFVVDDLNRMGVTTVNILGGTAAVNIDIHHVTVC